MNEDEKPFVDVCMVRTISQNECHEPGHGTFLRTQSSWRTELGMLILVSVVIIVLVSLFGTLKLQFFSEMFLPWTVFGLASSCKRSSLHSSIIYSRSCSTRYLRKFKLSEPTFFTLLSLFHWSISESRFYWRAGGSCEACSPRFQTRNCVRNLCLVKHVCVRLPNFQPLG